jgi:rhamnulokinase
VHLVAGHDTASAVVGIGATEPNPSYVATGTWILAGLELDAPVLTGAARTAGFSNEYGPERTTRYLKNIAGFWILEQCRREWGDPPVEEILAEAAEHRDDGVGFDATDPRFLAPASMLDQVLDASELPRSATRAATVNAIMNSLAQSTAAVIRDARSTSGGPPGPVHLIGGGVRAATFVDRLRHRLDDPVIVGAAESAALGNAMVQGISLGEFDDVADARGALVP